MVSCWVTGCKNKKSKDVKLSFYNIPKVRCQHGDQTRVLSQERRYVWLSSINRKDEPTSTSRVCSEHFISGKPSYLFDTSNPDWAPTLKLWNSSLTAEEMAVIESQTDLQSSGNCEVEVDVASQLEVIVKKEPTDNIECENEQWAPCGPSTVKEESSPAIIQATDCYGFFQDDFEPSLNGFEGVKIKSEHEFNDSSQEKPADPQMQLQCDFVKEEGGESNGSSQHSSQFLDILPPMKNGIPNSVAGDFEQSSNGCEGIQIKPEPEHVFDKYFQEKPANYQMQLLCGLVKEDEESRGSSQISSQFLDKLMPMKNKIPNSDEDNEIGIEEDSFLKSENDSKYYPFHCDFCTKGYFRWNTLKRHEKCHLSSEKYNCDKCHKVFTRKYGLTIHQRSPCRATHPCQCDICGKWFDFRYKLKVHKRTHPKVKPFKCSDCPKSFYQEEILHEHIQQHYHVLAFKCEVCFKVFPSRSSLYRHWNTHLNDKPFKCNICSKSFTMSSCLQNHMSVHWNPKDVYKCESCGKEFKNRWYFEDHMSSHANKKQHICKLCRKGFNTKSSLCAHRNRCHKCND